MVAIVFFGFRVTKAHGIQSNSYVLTAFQKATHS